MPQPKPITNEEIKTGQGPDYAFAKRFLVFFVRFPFPEREALAVAKVGTFRTRGGVRFCSLMRKAAHSRNDDRFMPASAASRSTASSSTEPG